MDINTEILIENSFQVAEELLKARIKSDEDLEISCWLRDGEIALNFECCNIDPNLLDEQDIIDKLNESDDFMYFSSIVSDRLACIEERVNELLSLIEDTKSVLHEGSFFEDDHFIGKELLQRHVVGYVKKYSFMAPKEGF